MHALMSASLEQYKVVDQLTDRYARSYSLSARISLNAA